MRRARVEVRALGFVNAVSFYPTRTLLCRRVLEIASRSPGTKRICVRARASLRPRGARTRRRALVSFSVYGDDGDELMVRERDRIDRIDAATPPRARFLEFTSGCPNCVPPGEKTPDPRRASPTPRPLPTSQVAPERPWRRRSHRRVGCVGRERASVDTRPRRGQGARRRLSGVDSSRPRRSQPPRSCSPRKGKSRRSCSSARRELAPARVHPDRRHRRRPAARETRAHETATRYGRHGVRRAASSDDSATSPRERCGRWGLPAVEAPGEAEATCAAMNAAGLVDGCATSDGDALLFGARVQFQNDQALRGRPGAVADRTVRSVVVTGNDAAPRGRARGRERRARRARAARGRGLRPGRREASGERARVEGS